MSRTLFGNETSYLIKQKQWKLLSQYFTKSLAPATFLSKVGVQLLINQLIRALLLIKPISER